MLAPSGVFKWWLFKVCQQALSFQCKRLETFRCPVFVESASIQRLKITVMSTSFKSQNLRFTCSHLNFPAAYDFAIRYKSTLEGQKTFPLQPLMVESKKLTKDTKLLLQEEPKFESQTIDQSLHQKYKLATF